MHRTDLGGRWIMTGEDGRSFPSEVPGSVLKTLLDHGAIPDPFDGMNETAACGETRQRWRFERTFRMTEEDLRYWQADLVFDGLDTLAAVELNGQTVARTDNMHRTWRIPVKEALRHGENRLRVVGVEDVPHWPVPGFAEFCWDFISRFRRDPATGRLVRDGD